MNKMKNVIESFDIRLHQAEEIISELKDQSFENYSVSGEKKKEEYKKVMTSMRYGKSSKESIHALQDAQKDRERSGRKYLRK